MKIELPIFYHTPETDKKTEMGIAYPITEDQIKTVTFYSINCVEQYLDKVSNKWYAAISCGDSMYLTPLSYEETVKRIDAAMVDDMQLNIA